MHHLRFSSQFKEILSTGRKLRSGRILLYVKKTREEKGITAGLIIPKKEVPLAVERNYIRRAIYAFLTEKEKNARDGAKMVIRLAGETPFKKKKISLELRESLEELLKKANITQ